MEVMPRVFKRKTEEKEPNSHYDRILNHLKDYGSITSLDAFRDYGNTRLSATIFLLRKDGYKISSEKVAFRNRYGKVVYFAKYILLED